ncbi:MAG: hypothetical protein WAN23_14510 [Candidatus Acidiferrales bacterium]
MPSQQPFRGAARVLHDPSKEMLARSGMPIKLDALPAADDCRNPAEHFVFGERRIVPAKSVAARDQANRPTFFCFIHQPMRVETCSPDEEYNVSGTGAFRRLALNNQSVSGKYRGNHARSPGDEPKLTERPQDFRCEVYDNIFATLVGLSAHRGRWG